MPLFTLFLAAFAFGTAEFVIAGVLPEVALGLGISIPAAGLLVTAYAVGIAVGGPLLALATHGLSRKSLIVWLCIVFVIGHVLCALAPNFELLLVARVVVAIVHGTYFGIASVVAIRLAPPSRRGFAVALVLAGLTVSNVIGVPIGAVIGTAFGWRSTFWAVGLFGVLATIACAVVLPRTAGGGTPRRGLVQEFRVLARHQVALTLLVALLSMIGQYSLFTYIAPLLREVTGLEAGAIPFMLLLYGAGATIGVFVGGRLADWRLMPSLIAVLFLQTVTFLGLVVVSPMPFVMAIGLVIWGGVNFCTGSPVNTRILQWAADAPSFASTLIPAAFNIGIAIGAATGGAFIEFNLSYQYLPFVGAACAALAAAVAILSAWLERWRGDVPPAVLQPGA